MKLRLTSGILISNGAVTKLLELLRLVYLHTFTRIVVSPLHQVHLIIVS